MDKLGLIERMLKEFGNPFYRLIPEKATIEGESGDVIGIWQREGKVPSDINTNITYSLPVIIEMNEKYPVHLQFFPNGNFMKNFNGKFGTPSKGLVGKSLVQGDVWNALVIDLDFVDSGFDNMELYFDYIINELGTIMPSFIVMSNTGQKTSGGFHLYYILDHSIRENINKAFKESEIRDMLEFAHTKFKGGDTNPSRYTPAAGIRMPFSNHRKSGIDIPTAVFIPKEGMKYDNIKKNIITNEQDFDNINYLTEDLFYSWYDNSQEYKKIVKGGKDVTREYGATKSNEIDQIPFSKIFSMLKRYAFDKTFSVRNSAGEIINVLGHIELSGSDLHIRELQTGVLYPTNGYKLNKEENYVNASFSGSSHPSRPQGSVLSFLRYYFGGDTGHLEKFLFDSFAIAFKDSGISEGEDVLWSHESKSGLFTITCTTDRVVRTKMFNTGKRKTTTHDTIIESPLKVISRARVNLDINMMETTSEQTVLFVEGKSGKPEMLFTVSNKRERNSRYQSSIGFFFGDDNDVGMLFSALEEAENIKDIKVRNIAGFYDENIYYLGNKIKHNKSDVVGMFRINETLNRGEDVSFKDYLNSIAEVFDKRVAISSMMMAVASMGMNAWEEVRDIANVSPAMFITGETEAGKSTMIELIKGAIGYDPASSYRSTSAGIFSSTKRPLQQMFSLYEPLFIEEFTGNVNPMIEEGVRNLLNREQSETGTMSAKNIKHSYRSSLFISGEMLSGQTSVNNRTFVLYMKRSYQIKHKNKDGSQKMLIPDIKKTTCYKDILLSRDKYFREEGYIKEAYNRAIQMLNKKGIGDRMANILAYPLASNAIVYSGFSDEEVLDAILWVIEESGIGKTTVSASKDASFRLKEMIMQEALKRKVIIFKKFLDKGGKNMATIYEVILENKFVNQYAPKINDIITEINGFTGDRSATMMSNTLLIKVSEDNERTVPLDRVMSQVLLATKNFHAEAMTEDDFKYYRGCF